MDGELHWDRLGGETSTYCLAKIYREQAVDTGEPTVVHDVRHGAHLHLGRGVGHFRARARQLTSSV
jgi:hypothetical protein